MPAPSDRVQLLKQESTALGGDDADAVEWGQTPIDPVEDAPEVQGIFYQPPGGPRDETTYTTRDNSGNLLFKDANVASERKLKDFVDYFEFLLDNAPIAETGASDCIYTATYSGVFITKEEWKRNDTTLIKSIDYTYTGISVATEVRKVFASNGTTIVAQVTWAYTYTGMTLTSATMTRNV